MKKIILLFSIVCLAMQTATAQITIDFETFTPYIESGVQLTRPIGWSGSDSFLVWAGKFINPGGTFQAQLFKENPGFAGTGALRVVTKIQDSIIAPTIANYPRQPYAGMATNSQIIVDINNNTFFNIGGTPVTHNAFNTSMYVKNNVVGGDSTFITALLIDDGDGGDSVLAIADTVLTANIATFTKITLPFEYSPNAGNVIATLVRYTIASGNPGGLLDTNNAYSVHDGTEIIVDNIELNNPTGVRQAINAAPVAKVYPTTGGETLYVDLIEKSKNFLLELYSNDGQKVFSQELSNLTNKISLSQLPIGSYIFSLKADGVIYQTGKLVR